ncbi:MAG: endopeptidase La, partial [Deltaproteobacteria bacterium]
MQEGIKKGFEIPEIGAIDSRGSNDYVKVKALRHEKEVGMVFLPRGGADKEEKGKEEKIIVPGELPILPLRGTVLYPDLILPIMVGRKRSVKLVDDAMDSDRIIGVLTQKRSEVEDPKEGDLYSVGVAALILRMIRELDGSQRVIVQGISRVKIKEYLQREPYYKAKVEAMEDHPTQGVEIEALMMNLKNLFQRAVELAPYLTSELGTMVGNIKMPHILADLIASNLNISTSEKQAILEIFDVRERLAKVHLFLNKEVQVLELGNKIQSQVKEDMDRTQREYYLREQLKAIKKELGEMDEHSAEIKELKDRVKKAKMPPEVHAAAEKELERLAKIPPASAEYTVARTYLDWLVEYPWSVTTDDNLDITNAQKILD